MIGNFILTKFSQVLQEFSPPVSKEDNKHFFAVLLTFHEKSLRANPVPFSLDETKSTYSKYEGTGCLFTEVQTTHMSHFQ